MAGLPDMNTQPLGSGFFYHFGNQSLLYHLPMFQPHELVTELIDLLRAMGNQNKRHTFRAQCGNLGEALVLERLVAYGKDLVGQQDIRFQMDSHGKTQAHLHPGGVVLERRVDEVFEFGEFDDVLHPLLDIPIAKAVETGVKKDVFKTRQFGIESHPQLDKGSDAPMGDYLTFGGNQDTGNNLQQGALAGAVVPQKTQRLATFNGETHIIQRQEVLAPFPLAGMKERQEAGFDPHGAIVAKDELLAQMVHDDGGRGHDQRSSTSMRALR